jgi:hypothetical protein
LAFEGSGAGFAPAIRTPRKKSRFLLVHRVGYAKSLILLMKSVVAQKMCKCCPGQAEQVLKVSIGSLPTELSTDSVHSAMSFE